MLMWFGLTTINSQVTKKFLPPKVKIDGNIIFVGVEHDSTGNQLINDSSRKIFCSVYGKIKKAAGTKKIIFLLEGVKRNIPGYPDEYVRQGLGLVGCFTRNDLFMGVENRTDSSRKNVLSAIYIIDNYIYSDQIDSTEKSLAECFSKSSILNFYNIPDSNLRNYVFKWGKVYVEENEKFERHMLEQARIYERNGYFVVVICGAVHALKIAMEEQAGYVLCMKYGLWGAVKSAKATIALKESFK